LPASRHWISRARRCFVALVAVGWLCLLAPPAQAQTAGDPGGPPLKRVLLVFSESRDLPGNVLMEQSVRAEILSHSTNRIEFFTESMDAAHFPSPMYYRLFGDYIRDKYAGQRLDVVMLFMARNYQLASELSAVLGPQVPRVYVVVNDLDLPEPSPARLFTGIFQRFDIPATIKIIFQLQPETRRVVVVGGTSPADQAVLQRIEATARPVVGVAFEYWTNRPMTEVYQAVQTLPLNTVILLASLQQDATGQPLYSSQVVRTLAPAANVPVYVLGEGSIGSGALGGQVVDFEELGKGAGTLASRVLAGTRVSQIPIAVQSNGVPMVDWRALQRWHIKSGRLPANCVIRYQPHSLWEEHWKWILFIATGFLIQATTIAALLLQRRRQQLAEAEILRQRAELAHVSRVSMMGQLASALTHELNQPLGAILRNAEAAEVYLQSAQPNLAEVRAILTDIRRDDKRAGNVIDSMRSLFKRQKVTLGKLDLGDLVADTIAMARPDAAARHVKLKVELPPHLPPARGDRVHIQQVLLNLILNGMDAMNTLPRSQRSLVLALAETKNGNLQIAVTDCGTGVAPDNAGRVFEPFFSTKSNGMGMGLAISKTIIEAHGGDIWMTTSGHGTTFAFILPPAGSDKVRPGDLPTAA
jgi:signal transduction histidine kinase